MEPLIASLMKCMAPYQKHVDSTCAPPTPQGIKPFKLCAYAQ